MSKYAFTQDIRNEYKQQARYIRTKAEIKLGGQRQGVNLLPSHTQKHQQVNYGVNITLDIKNWDCTLKGYYTTQASLFDFWVQEPFVLQPGTYTFTMIRDVSKGNQASTSQISVGLGTFGQSNIYVRSGQGPTTEKLYISETFTLNEERTIDHISISFDRNESEEQVYDESFKLMLNEGTERWPWWEGGSGGGLIDDDFTLGEDGICEIINFNVDETSDIYYEKMPYSELTINTDNNKGYFNDFGNNSIVNKLTKDVIMNFYLNINDTGWIRSWKMQFDSLKADNDKASLTFKPRCSRIFNSELYDKDRLFNLYHTLNGSLIYDYFWNNYDISVWTTDGYGIVITNGTHIYKNPSDILTAYAGDLNEQQRPQLLTITDNDEMYYKDIQYNTIDGTTERLTSNELLEKPIITKEELQGIVINYKNIESVSQETKKFQKSITSTFKSNIETLIIYCEDLDASGITQSNITLTNATLNWFGVSNDASNIASRYLLVEIQGNIDDQYTININADLNVIQLDDKQETFIKYQNADKDNFMQVEGFNNAMYWIALKEKMKKKVKLKVIGMPYLQVGDSITFEEEGKVVSLDDKVVITEIHTSWNNGFIMEIVAYKVYEANPDNLTPSNNLYPRNDLYPY